MLETLAPRVHRFADTCAVYVLTSGSRALLVDLGAGGVLSRLAEIGVEHVDWVLHTHHHRDQCQGDRLLSAGTAIAVPEREAGFFAEADAFWQSVGTSDIYDLTNHWQTLREPVEVTARLRDYDRFRWEDLEVLVVPTPGHTKGSVSYVVEVDGVKWSFCGDLVHSEGRVWTLHDLQWTYLGYEGVVTAAHSARALRRLRLDRLGPSHGPVADDPERTLAALEQSLEALWRPQAAGFSDIWDRPSPPLEPTIEVVTPHLLSVRAPVAHFHVLHDDGAALFFDYGFARWEHMGAGMRFVEHTLDELREQHGIERVEVVVPTHYHDDHVAGVPYLQSRFGSEVWAFERFAHFLERPTAYRVPCLYPEPIDVTRRIREGDEIEWHGFRFVAHHNPGHTRYAALYLGEVDGVRVAVAGDEFERDRELRLRGSAPVYRNHILPGDYAGVIARVRAFAPDVMLTGHIGVDRPTAADFDDCERWAAELEAAWRRVAPDPAAVGFALDPDVVSFDPYEAVTEPGAEVRLEIEVRNHAAPAADATVTVVGPAGWTITGGGSVAVDPHGAARVPVVVHVPADAAARRHVLAADVVLDGRCLGEAAEALVRVEG